MARRRPRLTARNSDRHALYEAAVQSPEAEVRFAERMFRRRFGRNPKVLREDFCGTGWLACEWAAHRRDCIAVGVDLDTDTLDWGRERHLAGLGDAARRVSLVEGDVREVGGRRADVTVALNFSYMVFHERAELLDYFRSVRRHLAREGLFILDVFGGTESQELLEEPSEKEGFRYVWDQDQFDPLTHRITCYIHFEFRDGSRMRKAFTYDWRLWTVPELRDVLAEAGFSEVDVYLENIGADGWGNGVFRRVRTSEPAESFVAYLVARKGA